MLEKNTEWKYAQYLGELTAGSICSTCNAYRAGRLWCDRGLKHLHRGVARAWCQSYVAEPGADDVGPRRPTWREMRRWRDGRP